MSRKVFTPEQELLLSLPVSLTHEAWFEAVHIEHPKSFSELAQRLAFTLKAGYHELCQQPYSKPVKFSLYRHSPSGDRSYRYFLQLQIEKIDADFPYLLISLPKDERIGEIP
ncbi:Uncharacterised protein [Pseudomonas luteola]|uniref:Uncharacterized protein n=1 Tax=Pseudomonas luteola TaxID=47886 RepID=A0A2X2C5E1_PSELU|nr:hypothetical protein [Pseudomonas luteola]SPZ02544.1 Uncharacterised protein [Pseudomonas luteola]